MQDYTDIKLNKPISIDGATVAALRMREPTVADQLASNAMKGDDATKEITLIANLCDVSPEDIKKLTLKDYRAVQSAFLDFTA